MERQIKFICNAARWFDKVNGNTYHSVRVIRCSDSETIAHKLTYGYGDMYRQTALELMVNAEWLPEGYHRENMMLYERENDYPILWNVSDGLKRDAVANGKL